MPEGHKTHWLAREHQRLIGSEKLTVTSPQGRFAKEAKLVSGKKLLRVSAAGKHLFYEFEGEAVIHVHLGRYGKFRESVSPPPRPVGLVRMRLQGKSHTLDLNGPTTCQVIDSKTRDEVVAKLGPDPLAGAKKMDVWNRVQTIRKPIGAILLDQAVVAGVGNIFRAEVLFEVGVDPRTLGYDLTASQFDAIWKSLVRMMKTGLKYGRIISVTAKEAGQPLAKVQEQDRFRVYGKTRCPRCQKKIEATEIASRKIYWCPRCQT